MKSVTTKREAEVTQLLLQGYNNKSIAKEMGIKIRTVKAYMNRLFLKHSIGKGGVKRVRLVVKLFREQCQKERGEHLCSPQENCSSQSSLLKDITTEISQKELEEVSTLLRTGSELSTINLASVIELSWLCGMSSMLNTILKFSNTFSPAPVTGVFHGNEVNK